MSKEVDALLGLNSRETGHVGDLVAVIVCHACYEENSPTAETCRKCGLRLDKSVPNFQDAGASAGTGGTIRPASAEKRGGESGRDSGYAMSMMSRYTDAYLVASSAAAVGAIIKVIGIVMGAVVFMVLVGPATQLFGGPISSRGNTDLPLIGIGFAFAVAAAILSVIYAFGVVLSALGQMLKAALDAAVNTSPFLSDSERAHVMRL